MSQPDERSGHRSDTGRAEAFSDAVLAIVITLLVLDLQPPQHRAGQLLTALLDQWPTYLAYLTSFLYVGVVWLNHKAAFNRISQMDRGLHWANLAILLATSLLPFPTAVIADAVESATRPTSGPPWGCTRWSGCCCASAGGGSSTTLVGTQS